MDIQMMENIYVLEVIWIFQMKMEQSLLDVKTKK